MATSSNFLAIYNPIMSLLLIVHCQASDPDTLQGFCTADYNSSASNNGFPRKPNADATFNNFFWWVRKEGKTSDNSRLSIATLTPPLIRDKHSLDIDQQVNFTIPAPILMPPSQLWSWRDEQLCLVL